MISIDFNSQIPFMLRNQSWKFWKSQSQKFWKVGVGNKKKIGYFTSDSAILQKPTQLVTYAVTHITKIQNFPISFNSI